MNSKSTLLNRRKFLKSAVLLGTTSGLPSTVFAGPPALNLGQSQFSTMNWSGSVMFRPKSIQQPLSIRELQDSVKRSARVKVMGSLHSFNSIAAPDETWLRLSSLPNFLRINQNEMTAEVPGWMPLRVANQLLEKQGLAFPSLGEIDAQTIAGLIATSTHGTGLAWGTISDSVQSLLVINSAGELIKVENGIALAAGRTHLGALGPIVSVTLKVVPTHHLERHLRFLPFNEVFDGSFIRDHDHTEIYYLPFADKTYVKTLDWSPKSTTGLLKKDVYEILKENLFLDISLRASSLKPSTVPQLMKMMAGQFGEVRDVGPSAKMMTSLRCMKYQEMELALDFDDLKPAFHIIRETIQELAERGSGAFFAHLPVTIRTVKGCPDNLLSPTLGRDTVYFSFASHTSFSNYRDYFQTVEKRLVDRFGARPHWGKHYSIHPGSKYPGWSDFQNVRQMMDPEGKFLNPFLKNLMSL